VIEDDGTLRAFYASALMFAGYRVVTAADGTEALHLLEEERPAAVVLDLGLPTLSGVDVARELGSKKELRDIPIVVVTGIDVADLDQQQFPCLLRKPVSAQALVDEIDRCASRQRRRR
jgi:DNA-binding response OmpR family regulator